MEHMRHVQVHIGRRQQLRRVVYGAKGSWIPDVRHSLTFPRGASKSRLEGLSNSCVRHLVVQIKRDIGREEVEGRDRKRTACRHHGTTCALRLEQTCSRGPHIRTIWPDLV